MEGCYTVKDGIDILYVIDAGASLKKEAARILTLSVDDIMSSMQVTRQDVIQALSSVTASLCIENTEARRVHSEGCAAHSSRAICTCGVGHG